MALRLRHQIKFYQKLATSSKILLYTNLRLSKSLLPRISDSEVDQVFWFGVPCLMMDLCNFRKKKVEEDK